MSRSLALPLPGPVLGMIFMLGWLLARRSVPAALDRAGRGLLDHLSLLFVPAGVGVVRYLDLLGAQWLPIGAAIIGSTILTMLVTRAVMRLLARPLA
ncbi:MAG: hypothetical protein NVSMB5_23900 [Candidatus Velthaea sp.]